MPRPTRRGRFRTIRGRVYNDPGRVDCNLRLPLWQLLRASTAAPVYFPAEKMRIGEQQFLFQDGGVTACNNPAFQMFVMATASPYRVGWKATRKDLLVVSVGTGLTTEANPEVTVFDLGYAGDRDDAAGDTDRRHAGAAGLAVPRVRGVPVRPADRPRSGRLEAMRGPGPKAIQLVRYNAELDDETLRSLGVGHLRAGNDAQDGRGGSHWRAHEFGRAVAEAQVRGRAPGGLLIHGNCRTDAVSGLRLLVVVSTGKNPDFLGEDLIDQPVFLVYAPRPTAGQLVPEWLGLAGT